jgi:hypothetical protein
MPATAPFPFKGVALMHNYEMHIPGWHSQGEINRTLLIANIGGIFATVAFGASGAPFIWHVVQWAASHLPPWQPAIPFPNPVDALLHPDWLTGIIWLAYYLLLYAIALFNPRYSRWIDREMHQYLANDRPAYFHMPYAGQPQRDEQPWQRERKAALLGPFLYRPGEDPDDYEGFDSLFERRRLKHVPLSQAWEGEEKYELVKRCYTAYREALARYNPSPIDLKTPPTFFYWKKKKLGYVGSIPILPEHLLVEEKFTVLTVLLAQHLYWYNLSELGDMFSGTLSSLTPDHMPGGWLTRWTGNFLWIPTNIAYRLRTDLEDLVRVHQKALVLEADAFAALLGQGEQFELQLRYVRWELEQNHLVDDQEPTLSERIGHLEALNKKARNELRARGVKVKEPPKFKPPANAWDKMYEELRADDNYLLGPGTWLCLEVILVHHYSCTF